MTRTNYRTLMDRAWQQGLDVLKPTAAELERGLALHRELPVCENYGFLPSVSSPRAVKAANELLDRGAGVAEWKQKSWTIRVTACTRDDAAEEEYFEALRRAGIRGMIQNVSDIGESLEYAVMNIAAHRHVCDTFKERLFQATSAAEVETADKAGRIGIFFSLTGLPTAGAGSMADPDSLLDWVDVWHQMGIRFMHLGYNRRNHFADGCTETRDGGLSDFGRELIARMNRAGIVVDVPHSSPRSTRDAVAASSRPVIATHAGCRAIHDHPRCKSDRDLKAIADSGGYVGIVALPFLLGPGADLNLMLRHVRHAVATLGADHVAIGTDTGYKAARRESPRLPAGLAAHSRAVSGFKPEHLRHDTVEHEAGSLAWTNWPLMTVGLLRMGLRPDEIEKILGGNLRRVLRACEPAKQEKRGKRLP